MAATDNLHPVQFHKETSDSDIDKHAGLDAMGQDADAEFGYSGYDMADYQWNRNKHSDVREVF